MDQGAQQQQQQRKQLRQWLQQQQHSVQGYSVYIRQQWLMQQSRAAAKIQGVR
jgi:hypothetical protein